MVTEGTQLLETRQAFDSVANEYDGPSGNNELIQRMRREMWNALTDSFPSGAHLLDIGCGTGIDPVYLASRGYHITATDWSPRMVERTRARATKHGLGDRIGVQNLGMQDLSLLDSMRFDGIYSNLGALNCATDIQVVAGSCARLLKPGGRLVASVIGRFCPLEVAYYLARGQWRRSRVRGSTGLVPVSLNGHTVWTRYYSPRELYKAFEREFSLTSYRSMLLCLPPPYLIGAYERFCHLWTFPAWLDDRLSSLPVFRNLGDHFLLVLTKRTTYQ